MVQAVDAADAATEPARLRITEIFLSIQGESRTVGWPTVFVRLTGCPLRCAYCDTEYAFSGGEWMGLSDIVKAVSARKTRHVTVTGGEPLAQKACRSLLSLLCDAGHDVSLETSGALPIEDIDERVSIVMDIKTPDSGEVARNRMGNLQYLRPQDQVKFVIGSESDYRWACDMLREQQLASRCEVLFSPVWDQLSPRQLAEWILRDHLPVRFQLQLHKVVWGDERGR